MIERDVLLGILWRDGQILICQRRQQDPLGGYWEFPGGKRETDETDEACLRRELEEELAVTARPVRAFDPIEHEYPTVRVRLLPYLCVLEAGEPKPLASQQVRWIEPADLLSYPFPPANDELLRQVSQLTMRP